MSTRWIVLALFPVALATAQELPGGGDFLTDYEVDTLREHQAVEQRIKAYVKFAALRLELIDQSMQEAEAGRGARIHRSLTEYSSIIQAIDDVIDDALARNRKMDGALEGLLEAEQGFAARLAALAAEPAQDAWRYEFVLEDAIGITEDSMELLAEDLGARKRDVLAQEDDAKRRQKESMAPERRREFEQDKREAADATRSQQQKRPSLLRPGEKLGEE